MNKKHYSLVELLIAISLLTLLTGAFYHFFIYSNKSLAREQWLLQKTREIELFTKRLKMDLGKAGPRLLYIDGTPFTQTDSEFTGVKNRIEIANSGKTLIFYAYLSDESEEHETVRIEKKSENGRDFLSYSVTPSGSGKLKAFHQGPQQILEGLRSITIEPGLLRKNEIEIKIHITHHPTRKTGIPPIKQKFTFKTLVPTSSQI